jgi:hypothetical protein
MGKFTGIKTFLAVKDGTSCSELLYLAFRPLGTRQEATMPRAGALQSLLTPVRGLLVSAVPKMSQGSFPYQIVVGTPGKITDLVKARVINMREIKIFVLDEADAMLDQQGLKDQTMRVHAYALRPRMMHVQAID